MNLKRFKNLIIDWKTKNHLRNRNKLLNNKLNHLIILVQISQGKRNAEDYKGAWSDLLSAVQTGAYDLANQLASRNFFISSYFFETS